MQPNRRRMNTVASDLASAFCLGAVFAWIQCCFQVQYRPLISPCKTVTYRDFFRDAFFSVIRFCDEHAGIPGAPDSVSAFPESMGFPIPIRNDGTLSLPCIQPVYVQDKSLREIHELVRSAYQKVIPNQNIAIRIRLFPERQYWKKEHGTESVFATICATG